MLGRRQYGNQSAARITTKTPILGVFGANKAQKTQASSAMKGRSSETDVHWAITRRDYLAREALHWCGLLRTSRANRWLSSSFLR
jgi:hypothetical protein